MVAQVVSSSPLPPVKTPEWEVIVSFGSVLLILFILVPAGFYAIRRWRPAGAVGLVLTLTALAYPVIPFGHLTSNSSEIADGQRHLFSVAWHMLYPYGGSVSWGPSLVR